MPVRKLRLISLVIEISRVVAEAVRRAGPMLLLPAGLFFLQSLASSRLFPTGKLYSVAGLVPDAVGTLAGWMLLLMVGRASLRHRSGLDLLRPDRLALMLLGLEIGYVIVIDLMLLTQGSRWQVLALCTIAVLGLPWTLATLLLSVSWAVGIEMTFIDSWKRLRGNFLRILGLGVLSVMVVVVFTLTHAYSVNGNVSPPFPTISPLAEAILSAFIDVMSSAVPCAIYRQLVVEPSPPSGTPELGTVTA